MKKFESIIGAIWNIIVSLWLLISGMAVIVAGISLFPAFMKWWVTLSYRFVDDNSIVNMVVGLIYRLTPTYVFISVIAIGFYIAYKSLLMRKLSTNKKEG